MALRVTSTSISSDTTRHTATKEDDGWHVSWLPGRNLTQSQAISAMMIAEKASQGVGLSGDPLWVHLEGLAAELGMSAAMAVARASEPPPETAR